MTLLLVPSRLRERMNASDLSDDEDAENLDWSLKEVHLLTRMRHRLTETRIIAQEHRYHQPVGERMRNKGKTGQTLGENEPVVKFASPLVI